MNGWIKLVRYLEREGEERKRRKKEEEKRGKGDSR